MSCSPHHLRRTPLPGRNFHISKALKERDQSFRGQLYQSTAERLERERAEQRRFAEARGEAHGGRNAAFTFGLITLH